MNPVDLDFVKRYVALWNEPKAARRRQTIEELWTADGANYTPSIQAVGYDAIDARVTSSYERYIAPGTHHFRAHQPPTSHHGVVMVTWAMVTLPDEGLVSVGVEFLRLDNFGRIVSDHQFIVK